jgi:plasmid stability protein
MHQRHNAVMATIQIRNVPADVHRTLRTRAAAAGQSLQEFLLAELVDLAGTTDFLEILAELDAEKAAHPERFSTVSTEEIVRIVRNDRESH